MSAEAKITAIILAAGESRRMGVPKQLLPFEGRTIIEKTISNYISSRVDEIIVVVGHHAAEIHRTISHFPVKIVENPLYHTGMSSSMIAGIKAASKESSGYILALADQPGISHAVINRLIAALKESNKGIVIPVYNGKRGNPVLFSSRYKTGLLSISGDNGGREIVHLHTDDVLEVSVHSKAVCQDIDTREHYQSAIKEKR